MEEKIVLTWSVENWITVLLMVAVGFAVLKFGASFIASRTGSGS